MESRFLQIDVAERFISFSSSEEMRYASLPSREDGVPFQDFSDEEKKLLLRLRGEFNSSTAVIIRTDGRILDHASQFNRLFLNKGGLKLANIFGSFRLETPTSVLDIGGGPGGFASFIRERSQGQCQYEGITLDRNDFRWDASVRDFVKGYYLDILQENVSFGKKYHHVYSDLGAVDEEYQSSSTMGPLLEKAIDITHRHIAPGGVFICKMFDIVSTSTLKTVFELSRYFSHRCVFKPFTSRATNSEFYFVGVGYGEPGPLLIPNNFIEELKIFCAHRGTALTSFNLHKDPVYDTSSLPLYWNFP